MVVNEHDAANNLEQLVIELHQLNHVIDDLEHDNDDNNSMRPILHVHMERRGMGINL